ncbi:amino acid transporter heavy chain SLC3A2 [Leptinotarsa decemlineata]|uniref:amino acid transporter heavy chain SLC3A2 n=1 Tax=Leptinotarsa decemlineata TaxID=7539 RepID=UPI003D3064DC
MEGFLGVKNSTLLPASPSSSLLADEVASICPLITPSPPTNDFINPLQEPTDTHFVSGLELATKLKDVSGSDEEKAESASSSSSALAEPACEQLLNHRNVHHYNGKNVEKEPGGASEKSQQLQLTFRNPPDNYFFMTWNWPLIRKISTWLFLSGLVAMVALVVAMISTLPQKCNPPTFWYQGNLLYEIFPASFYNGGQNMEGDFKGISMKADYIMELGARGVRLNSIFDSPNYPYDFENITSLTDIAPSLGTLKDFSSMVKHLNSRNISLILDLPIFPFVKKLVHKKMYDQKNESNSGPTMEFLRSERDEELDIIEESILYWISNGVEGFYFKGLEYLKDDPFLANSLRRWKKILGENRVIIVSEAFISSAPKSIINIILNNVDLVDVKLNLEKGVTEVSKQIGSLQNGTLFSKPGMPWIHWSLGNANSNRLANTLPYANATLGATLLQLMLPGTPCIFYGDEIGLQQIADTQGERQDIKHLHQLTMMPWQNQKLKVLPWIHGDGEVVGSFHQKELISKMVALRTQAPSIYMNSVYKEGVNKANAEVKYAGNQFLVIQRWYPRRNAYVVASNLGTERLSTDLSTLLYTGKVVIGPRTDSSPGTISFKDISLWPGESVVVVLN